MKNCKKCDSDRATHDEKTGLTQYKTIDELREKFENHCLPLCIYNRNADGDYENQAIFAAWNGYLHCAQDFGLLPPDVNIIYQEL